MAKNSIRDFDSTAANNTDIQSTDISEGCAASGINNAIRELMADIKDVSTGAVNLETPAADRLDVDNIRIDGNTISSTDTNGDITLDPNGTGDTIIASGNLGVGTTSPGGLAEFYKAGTSEVLIGSDNGGTAQLSLYENDDGTKEGLLKYDGTNNRIHLATSGNANALVMLRDSGNIGLNQTSPSYPLHVSEASGDTAAIFIDGPTDGYSVLYLGDSDDIDRSMVSYNHTNDDLTLRAGARNGWRLNGSGTVISENVAATAANFEINGATTNGHYNILMNGATTNGYKVLFRHGTAVVGTIITNSSSTAYNTSSDYRLKENVADMTGAIARVKQLSPKRFSWIVDDLDAANVDGFLAHEAQTVVPEAVHGTHNQVDDEGEPVYQGIDQSKMVPLLTGALQEAITKIETLETEMTALKARVTALEDA